MLRSSTVLWFNSQIWFCA